VFFGSLPTIWNVINHTEVKTEIAYANNPSSLLTEIEQIKKEKLQLIPDSIIDFGQEIMNNKTLTKDQKADIFAVRNKRSTYEKYSAADFNKQEFINEQEKIMKFKNISRPFLLIVFGLITYMVHSANKKRKLKASHS
jgi:hypothetical protein